MTPDTTSYRPTADGPSDRASGERIRAVFVVVLASALALAAALGAAGAVTAQEGPVVEVTDASVDPGGTASVQVALASAPEGLAGYELLLSVSDPAVATVTGANYADGFGLTTDPAVSDDGRTVRLEAADVDGSVEAGATDVTLASVDVRGVAAGETGIEVRPVQFDADGGVRMNVGGGVGSVTVGDPASTATGEATTASAAATTTGGARTAGTDATDGSPETDTSGRGSLPLAGLGVAALAVALLAGLLAQRR